MLCGGGERIRTRPGLFFAFVDLKGGGNELPDVFMLPSVHLERSLTLPGMLLLTSWSTRSMTGFPVIYGSRCSIGQP